MYYRRQLLINKFNADDAAVNYLVILAYILGQ